MKSPSRYVLYTRVSTEGQDDNFSHDSQLAALQTHVVKRGGFPVDIIRETASGGSFLGRPGIQRALSILESDRADVLVCYDMSRFSRDVEHQQSMVRRMNAAGKRLEFATVEFARDEYGELTPESELHFGMDGQFARYHKRKIRSDSMRGAKQAAQNGNQPRRKSPLGYHIVNNRDVLSGRYEKSQLGKYLIVESEAAIVREMYERRAQGQSLTHIASWLQEQGIITRSGATMAASGISKILSNTLYKGQAHYGQTRRVVDESRLGRGFKRDSRYVLRPQSEIVIIPAPAIVDESLWNHVYAMRATVDSGILRNSVKSFKHGEREAPTRYLLSSLLRCPRCGGGMSGRSQSRSARGVSGRSGRPKAGEKAPEAPRRVGRYYVCRLANTGGPKEIKCLARSYEAKAVDIRIVEFLTQLYSDEQLVAQLLAGDKAPTPSNARGSELREEISKLETRERQLIEAQMRAMETGADAGMYERMIVEASQSRIRAQGELQKLEKSAKPIVNRDSAAFRTAFLNVREYLTQPLEPGSKALHELHCFLIAQFESIEFEELDLGTKSIPRYQIGKLKINAR